MSFTARLSKPERFGRHAYRRDVGPVLFVLGALLDPFDECRHFRWREDLVRVLRWHALIRVGRRHAPDQLALARTSRNDRALVRILGQLAVGALGHVEPQPRLARGRSEAMTAEAVLRKGSAARPSCSRCVWAARQPPSPLLAGARSRPRSPSATHPTGRC